jgi:hypothetical protein
MKATALPLVSKFQPREAGHRLIIEYLTDTKTLIGIKNETNTNTNTTTNITTVDEFKCATMVEVGCTREEYAHLDSTGKLAILAEMHDMTFWSVDVDPDNLNRIKDRVKYKNFKTANQAGEAFLQEFSGEINILYLDGFDFTTGPNHHSNSRKEKYQKYLKTEITNEECYKMHLDCVRLAHHKIGLGGLICINDVMNSTDYNYKGKLAVPFLLETGCYEVVRQEHNAILLKKKTL